MNGKRRKERIERTTRTGKKCNKKERKNLLTHVTQFSQSQRGPGAVQVSCSCESSSVCGQRAPCSVFVQEPSERTMEKVLQESVRSTHFLLSAKVNFSEGKVWFAEGENGVLGACRFARFTLYPLSLHWFLSTTSDCSC
jgi:hypothetical protein